MLVAGWSVGAYAGAPTFQELMEPGVFPEAQRGMVVEGAEVSEAGLRIVTTGAEFSLDGKGRGSFRQRIGHAREVLRIGIEGVAGAPVLRHSGSGFALASFEAPKLDIRANGDSLFMFHAREAVTVELERAIDVGFAATYKGNGVVLDEWGGFGLFCSEAGFGEALRPYEETVARYTLPADAVLWVGICPPKAYDWERSIRDHVVWHWSMETGYPADADLKAWAKEGNTVLLQSEVMLWKDWNLAFEPRLGEAEFARVRQTIHDEEMRFIVYTSPYYFLKGTPLEARAMNSFENYKETGFPPGWPEGNNIDLFIDEIRKVMTTYKPDGLYFDGQYTENVPALYALARRAREVVGEEGILEWHSTAALGNGLCFLPQADAYVDSILRGEGRPNEKMDFDYLRYFVSCYNASNSIGVLCNNGPKPTAELMEQLLSANGRMHTIASWLAEPEVMAVVRERYRAQLTPALRERVEREAAERQDKIAERTRARMAEAQALRAEPAWGEAVFAETGEGFLKWTASVSPLNGDAFAVRDGALVVTGKANTYAFVTHALEGATKGFVVKIKQGTDAGASWGPGVLVRWKNGERLRVGLRGDGLMQWDRNGEQRLFGKHAAGDWTWIRVRWLERGGVVEASGDGIGFEWVWAFEHDGGMAGALESIAVGKVPYDGAAVDHSEAGVVGSCLVG
ncbi:MAG: hypothetical protein RBU21_13945, partial [FCB group bacterium]|nr:hypothetical protein [FCB group bacterium]